MTTTYDSKRFVLEVGLVLATLLSGLTGGLWWFFATFTFESQIARELHELAALGLGVWTVATAVLSGFVWWQFRASLWPLILNAVVVMLMTVGTVHEVQAAQQASPLGYQEYGPTYLWLLVACPTSWPLLGLALAAVVRQLRARSYPAPRSRPAR
jgi:hypothetical protein